jgi:hypothetical protein
MFHCSANLTITPLCHRSLSKPPSRGLRRTRFAMWIAGGLDMRRLSSP